MNNIPIPEIRVGEPVQCGALAVVPLFTERRILFPDSNLDYLLSDEAMEMGACAVREVSEEGKVGELSVDNIGDRPVLFLEGEELEHGKQNRVVCSSVLVSAGSRTTLPVFCVERKRWGGSSPNFTAGAHSPPSLRHILKGGNSGMGISRGFGGQAAVWRLIEARHRATGTISEYENMSESLRSHPEIVKELRQSLPYPEGALGIAVTKSGRTVGIDLLDSPRMLKKLWDRLVVLGLTLDAMDLRTTETRDSDLAVRLYMLRDVKWNQVPTVGLGEFYRARGDDMLATALVVDGSIIHLSGSVPV